MLARLLILWCLALAVPATFAAEAAATQPTTMREATTIAASPAQQLEVLRQDVQTTRDLLREIDAQLDAASGVKIPVPSTAPADVQRERLVMLNSLKTRYQFRLDELRRDIRAAELEQTAAAFAGVVDVFMSVDELKTGVAAIRGATFHDTIELAGRQYVRLKSGVQTWTIDPHRILAVRSTPPRR